VRVFPWKDSEGTEGCRGAEALNGTVAFLSRWEVAGFYNQREKFLKTIWAKPGSNPQQVTL